MGAYRRQTPPLNPLPQGEGRTGSGIYTFPPSTVTERTQ